MAGIDCVSAAAERDSIWERLVMLCRIIVTDQNITTAPAMVFTSTVCRKGAGAFGGGQEEVCSACAAGTARKSTSVKQLGNAQHHQESW